MKSKFYITFGQLHIHKVDKNVCDKDCVGVIHAKDYHEATQIAFRMFGDYYYTIYEKVPDMEFFPRGFISVNNE